MKHLLETKLITNIVMIQFIACKLEYEPEESRTFGPYIAHFISQDLKKCIDYSIPILARYSPCVTTIMILFLYHTKITSYPRVPPKKHYTRKQL